jgi:hypothetical protein
LKVALKCQNPNPPKTKLSPPILKYQPTTVGSRSTNTALGTCLPAPRIKVDIDLGIVLVAIPNPNVQKGTFLFEQELLVHLILILAYLSY